MNICIMMIHGLGVAACEGREAISSDRFGQNLGCLSVLAAALPIKLVRMPDINMMICTR